MKWLVDKILTAIMWICMWNVLTSISTKRFVLRLSRRIFRNLRKAENDYLMAVQDASIRRLFPDDRNAS